MYEIKEKGAQKAKMENRGGLVLRSSIRREYIEKSVRRAEKAKGTIGTTKGG